VRSSRRGKAVRSVQRYAVYNDGKVLLLAPSQSPCLGAADLVLCCLSLSVLCCLSLSVLCCLSLSVRRTSPCCAQAAWVLHNTTSLLEVSHTCQNLGVHSGVPCGIAAGPEVARGACAGPAAGPAFAAGRGAAHRARGQDLPGGAATMLIVFRGWVYVSSLDIHLCSTGTSCCTQGCMPPSVGRAFAGKAKCAARCTRPPSACMRQNMALKTRGVSAAGAARPRCRRGCSLPQEDDRHRGHLLRRVRTPRAAVSACGIVPGGTRQERHACGCQVAAERHRQSMHRLHGAELQKLTPLHSQMCSEPMCGHRAGARLCEASSAMLCTTTARCCCLPRHNLVASQT